MLESQFVFVYVFIFVYIDVSVYVDVWSPNFGVQVSVYVWSPNFVSKFRFTFGVPISCPSFSLRLESQFRVPICFKKGREGAKETKKEERVQHWDFPGGHPS